MTRKFTRILVAGALGTALALASPAFGRGMGGGGGGGHGGGGGGMGMGGGMGGRGMGGGMGGGMGFGGMGGGRSFAAIGPGRSFGGMGARSAFVGNRFATRAAFVGNRFGPTPWSRAAFTPRFSRFAFRHRFFHHRRFAFFGGPFIYASYYDSCWRRVWTGFGVRWVNVCGDYGDYGYY